MRTATIYRRGGLPLYPGTLVHLWQDGWSEPTARLMSISHGFNGTPMAEVMLPGKKKPRKMPAYLVHPAITPPPDLSLPEAIETTCDASGMPWL
jgi:hypothetical protein